MEEEEPRKVEIRECKTVEDLALCVDLQREVFGLPEIEISPVRHFIVTKNAGGWTLGAFADGRLVGFVLSVPAFLRGEKAFYSHMTAVAADFQSAGVGAKLKWAQRERALREGVKLLKWTFEPAKARNAYFNIEKLGAAATEYLPNFYGMDYSTGHTPSGPVGLASDRLFAEWALESEKTAALAAGCTFSETAEPLKVIHVPGDWVSLVDREPQEAIMIQSRIRREFAEAFAAGLEARGFVKNSDEPHYLLYEKI